VKKTSSFLALALVAAGLAVGGCGADKQESVSVSLGSFTSPKGNIGCIADDSMVRCDIKRHSWKVKKNPGCKLDYGNGLSVDSKGPGKIVCAGDTTMNSGPDVVQGTVNMVGSFQCQTNEAGDGMHCENVTTGHGFEMDPQDYSVF